MEELMGVEEKINAQTLLTTKKFSLLWFVKTHSEDAFSNLQRFIFKVFLIYFICHFFQRLLSCWFEMGTEWAYFSCILIDLFSEY